MDFSEKWGKDIDEAVELALKDLKVSIDEVDVIVMEEPSKGFLGIGSKLAKVRVEKKKIEEVIEEPKEEVKPVKKKEGKPKKEVKTAKEVKTENKVEKKIPKNSILNKPEDLIEVEDHKALDFLKETTEKMGLSLSFKAKVNKDNIYIDIAGEDAGTIIGKRGQTLDSIQYLTSLIVNKDNKDYIRVVLDAENYREKREKTLESLGNRLAGKVVKTGRYVKLEPMNPYERMVIHATLQDNPKVYTRSEGEEPYRRVIIELK